MKRNIYFLSLIVFLIVLMVVVSSADISISEDSWQCSDDGCFVILTYNGITKKIMNANVGGNYPSSITIAQFNSGNTERGIQKIPDEECDTRDATTNPLGDIGSGTPGATDSGAPGGTPSSGGEEGTGESGGTKGADEETSPRDDFGFPETDCGKDSEASGSDAPEFNSNDFLGMLGAKTSGETTTQTNAQNLNADNIERDGEKVVMREDFNIDNFDFSKDSGDGQRFNDLWTRFSQLNKDDKGKVWDEIKTNPKLQKNFIDVMGKKMGGVEFDAEIGDDFNWEDGGRLDIGNGMQFDFCAIENYNNKFNSPDGATDFGYSLEGENFKGIPPKISKISLDSSRKNMEFQYENGASMSLDNGEEGQKILFDPNERKVFLNDGTSTKEIEWANNKGKVSVSNSNEITAGVIVDESGKNFAIIEVDGKTISPYQKYKEGVKGGTKPSSRYDLFESGGKTHSIDSKGKTYEVNDAKISLETEKAEGFSGGDFENSYVELEDTNKGKFFFGDGTAEGKEILNSFRFNDDGTELELFGNVIYEQKKDFKKIILGPQGDSIVINGNAVFSKDKEGKILVRGFDGKGATAKYDGLIVTDTDPSLDGFEEGDKVTIKGGVIEGGRIKKQDGGTGVDGGGTGGGINFDVANFGGGLISSVDPLYQDDIDSASEKAKKNGRPQLVLYNMPGCGSCKAIKEKLGISLDQFSGDVAGRDITLVSSETKKAPKGMVYSYVVYPNGKIEDTGSGPAGVNTKSFSASSTPPSTGGTMPPMGGTTPPTGGTKPPTGGGDPPSCH